MGPLSNELVLVVVVAAVLLGIYLLRHIIAFAFKLIVFVGLVLAGVWAWQHRTEIVDAVRPYIGPVGDRLGELDLSDVRGVLADLLSDEEPSAAEATGGPGAADATGDPGGPAVPGEPGSSVAPDGHESPDGNDNPVDLDDPSDRRPATARARPASGALEPHERKNSMSEQQKSSMSERQMDRRTLLKSVAVAGMAAPFTAGAAARAAAAGGTAAAQADVAPFTIEVGDEALEDLRRRLAATRWPPDSPGEPWGYGTDRAYLEELIAYWRDDYDWRATRQR